MFSTLKNADLFQPAHFTDADTETQRVQHFAQACSTL